MSRCFLLKIDMCDIAIGGYFQSHCISDSVS